ncbi:MAG: metallophosphoesterase [Endomicrobiales bacterium]|nr:metallophosphoesterase [Endomicrobiales bacterium]
MKILAVSDVSSQSLENYVAHSSKKLKKLDIIVSCGDLDKQYLEYLADGIGRDLFFIHGNHVQRAKEEDGKILRYIAGSEDLHGRAQVYNDYIIVGFGGSKWYGGKGYEYKEKEMVKVVKKVIRKVKWIRFKDKIIRRKKKEIIAISHAPMYKIHDQPDVCHTGFKCFHDFVKAVSPVLWLHGHVHIPDTHKNQVTVLHNTTILNVFGYKFVNVGRDSIDISYKNDILDS